MNIIPIYVSMIQRKKNSAIIFMYRHRMNGISNRKGPFCSSASMHQTTAIVPVKGFIKLYIWLMKVKLALPLWTILVLVLTASSGLSVLVPVVSKSSWLPAPLLRFHYRNFLATMSRSDYLLPWDNHLDGDATLSFLSSTAGPPQL